jgi:phosphatidate phosphatase APP1
MPRLRDLARLATLKARQAGRLAHYIVTRRRPADIAAYRGYGTLERVYVHGRVLGRPTHAAPDAGDRAWRNMLNAYRRARSSPVPQAEVRASFADASRLLRADDEGFFADWLELPAGLRLEPGWQGGTVELVTPVLHGARVTASTQLLIPQSGARFGVISDIDDTVIQSHVTSFLRAARVVLMKNALTRLPFEGVAEFYSALANGSGDEGNPIFYVSSSPWNLYDVIEDFLVAQGIPAGPLLLRDWDLKPSALAGSSHHTHKEAAIREIMAAYPNLPFILIGDSGQKDPEIYAHIVHENPKRILAVYIRDVVRQPGRENAITELAVEVSAAGSELLLLSDTREAAAHAAGRGWIVPAEVAAVVEEAAVDAGEAPGKKSPESRD